MTKIDEKNKKLLEALQEDSKQGLSALSKRTGIPKQTVWRRVKQLERKGVIQKYVAVVDPDKVNNPAVAICLVKLKEQYPAKNSELPIKYIADALAKYDEIEEVHSTAGSTDIIFKLRGKSEKEIGSWLMETTQKIPGIQSVNTNIVFYTAKDTQKVRISSSEK